MVLNENTKNPADPYDFLSLIRIIINDMKTLYPFIILLSVIVTAIPGCKSRTQQLWNGQDFTGWTFVLEDSTADPADIWTVQDGVIHCSGAVNGYMRTVSTYTDYRLTLEWRWPEAPANSGVLTHMQLPDKVWPNCIECQLQAEHAGDIILMPPVSAYRGDTAFVGDTTFVFLRKRQPVSEKAPGEWNNYEIICDGDMIRASVNGILQNEISRASLTEGYICLQSEGGPIEFRNIMLEPLKK